MSANSSLSLTSLDFDTLKSSFTTFLKAQTIFKDYDYTGSNINVLLDVLAYNSYLNSFYLNMVFTEMFMDSAQNLNSVISHAKELNYVPISAKSSVANLNFSIITNGISSPLTIPKGALFSGKNSNGTYTFTTNESYNFVSSNNIFNANISVYEGTYTTDIFIIDYSQNNQQFILSNENIDTDSLTVVATENGSNNIFSVATTLYGLNSNSNVYFIQSAQNGKYEILFGDNLFGRIPINASLISVSYRISSGSDTNNIASFSLFQNLGLINGGQASVPSINVIANSSGGSNSQSIESIRFYAPRYFAAQERAVAGDDYASLILSRFSGQIADVSVYGGELLNPKKYGSTAVSLLPTSGTITPNYVKNEIINYLTPLITLPNKVILTDPDYFYMSVTSNVVYISTDTTLSSSDIKTEVLNSMIEYFSNNDTFSSNFRYSKFGSVIDNTDLSIDSNDTDVLMIKRLNPIANISSSYTINYNNPISLISYTYPLLSLPVSENKPSVFSTTFTYFASSGSLYPNAIIRDDNYGNLVIFNQLNGIVSVVNNNIGSVNYTTGLIQINNLRVTDFSGDYISLYILPKNKDILVSQNQILKLDPNDVYIDVTDSD